MDTARITEILSNPVTLDLVERQPIMQIAYAAADGSPRAVPIGYLLREGKFLFFTVPSSDKVAALHHDPRIALTIDVLPPLCCLLVRGTAELLEEDGVPDEYLEASFRTMPEDQHTGFEEQVRALYDSMVRVVVTRTVSADDESPPRHDRPARRGGANTQTRRRTKRSSPATRLATSSTAS